MLSPKLQKLADYRAKVEQLEKSLSAERNAVLRRLHTEVGFSTREELIEALRGLGGGPRGRRGRVARGATGRTPSGRKKRATITPELREQVVAAAKGGATGKEIAKTCGISLPSVQNIKRDAGLTKKRRGR